MAVTASRRREHPVAEGLERPRLSYVMGRLDRALRRHLEDGVRQHGVTVPQYTALSVLRARGGLSNAQLARRSFMTPQSMFEVLAKLEAGGYVTRTPDPTHGRILRTQLTPAGIRVLNACDRVADGVEEMMLNGLSSRDREQLYAQLRSCVQMLGAGLADT